ncbi:MAG: hypothetical protein BGO26_19050 [Actinobacteria bacterium 69-20]|nr:MAG: hypothetical protein BGO26_19050 [Actinobacteria bacterium 69-20]
MQVIATLPKMSDSIDDVVVLEIPVEIGDRVRQGDPILIVETDKVNSEVPAPAAGSVEQILVSVDDEISTGTPIMMLETDGAA